MISYTKNNLRHCLCDIGLKKNDVVFCSSSLFELGILSDTKNKNELCATIFSVIMEIIGPDGTLVVPTYTPVLGMQGGDFILEETPTTTGIFNEYVRNIPDSIRSLHPINSVAALGKLANDICDDIPANCYSIDSPFYRLYEMNAKAITLGATRPLGAWVHLSEALSGVPYIYNKLLDINVYINEKKIDKQFFTSVRYLDLNIKYNIQKVEKYMFETGVIKKNNLGNGCVSVMEGKRFFETSIELIKSDPYVYLDTEVIFEKGKIPRDGFTKKFHK